MEIQKSQKNLEKNQKKSKKNQKRIKSWIFGDFLDFQETTKDLFFF